VAFNPLTEKGIPIDQQTQNWAQLNVQPYDKSSVDPYTRCRIILMNGIEVESAIFLHQFARHTDDLKLKQQLAMARRTEQQQQKAVNWLVPGNESNLEVTVGYEQVAVDLTAHLARTEPDPYVKQALDFALLEDFDHLYVYSNLLEMDQGMDPAKIVGNLTEIMPGRPTSLHHRHPYDSIRNHYDGKSADILTKLHVQTIVAGEQQTMNLYMTIGDRYVDELGRGAYLEIAQVEEQHVSHYESLADPNSTWLEMMALHDYNEAYMYYSCMESESDPRVRRLWEHHLMMEVEHLRLDGMLLKQYEGRELEQLFPSSFPSLTVFQSNKDYVRDVLASQVDLTAEGTDYVPMNQMRNSTRFRAYQEQVNGGGFIPSQEVLEKHIKRFGQDYRLETEGQNPVAGFRSRTSVPGQMARV
jgi:hypothetical protein